ncbi:MAG: hypothetical protein P0S96_03665 [Simkaniaceae bacterium]|nr:hypothetical protein [Candidatus Sacchlamyda saccharinae]
MQTASYAQSLHLKTEFTQIKQDDGITTRAWKVPTGRIASSAVTIVALAEALIFSLATVVFSPLYVIDNARFQVLVDDAKDSARTAGQAAGRIFGFGHIEIEEPKQMQTPAPQSVPQPTTLKGKVLALFSNGAKSIGYTALKNPNATLVLATSAIAISTAYYFGLFEYAASLSQAPKTPVMQNMRKFSDFNPFPHAVCILADAPKTAAAQATAAVVENGVCFPAPTTPWLNATTANASLAYFPPSTSLPESRIALWLPTKA